MLMLNKYCAEVAYLDGAIVPLLKKCGKLSSQEWIFDKVSLYYQFEYCNTLFKD